MKQKVFNFILLSLLAFVYWGGEYSVRKLWEPDEARFAYVAREMIRDDHWAVPHRHGEYYAHKPPMLFWLIRGATFFTGGEVNNISARIPTFLGAVLTLWMTGLLAVRFYGPKAFWPSVLVLMTTIIFWHEGGMGRMDSLLCGLSLTAIYFLLHYDDDRRLWKAMLAYSCLGLGIITKGPVGLIIPLGAYLAMRIAQDGRHAFRKHLVWGILLALLFPAVWLYAADVEGAEYAYFSELLIKQNIHRLTGENNFGKPAPLYYYIPRVVTDMLPWTIVFITSIVALYKKGERLTLNRLLLWAGWVVLAFSLSTGKRNIYIMLAYPAFSIMIAGAIDHISEMERKWTSITMIITVAIAVILGMIELMASSVMGLMSRFEQYKAIKDLVDESKIVDFDYSLLRPAGIVLLAGSLSLLILLWRGRQIRTLLCVLAMVFAIHHVCISNIAFPGMNKFKTPSAEAIEFIKKNLPPDRPLLIFSETQEITPYYCGVRAVNAEEPEELKRKMNIIGRGVLIYRVEDWNKDRYRIRLRGLMDRIDYRVGGKEMKAVKFNIPKGL